MDSFEKACKVIESLTGDDFSEDVEARYLFGYPFTHEEAQEMARRLTKIYTLVHGIDKTHQCYEVHQNWRDELEKMYQGLKRGDECAIAKVLPRSV